MAYFPKYRTFFNLQTPPKFLEIRTKLQMSKLEKTFSISEVFKVEDYSLIIYKFAYYLFSVLISRRSFPSLQTRKTFGEILSGNHRFLIPVITVVTPHNWAYLLYQASHFYATKVLSIEYKDFL